MRLTIVGGFLLCACALLAGCRSRADARKVVVVSMGEFWFRPSDSLFMAGVPYTVLLRNEGSQAHEWAVVPRGDADESRLVTEVEEGDLPPGATVRHELVFPDSGAYDLACFLPGHYEAGMVYPVNVRAP